MCNYENDKSTYSHTKSHKIFSVQTKSHPITHNHTKSQKFLRMLSIFSRKRNRSSGQILFAYHVLYLNYIHLSYCVIKMCNNENDKKVLKLRLVKLNAFFYIYYQNLQF